MEEDGRAYRSRTSRDDDAELNARPEMVMDRILGPGSAAMDRGVHDRRPVSVGRQHELIEGDGGEAGLEFDASDGAFHTAHGQTYGSHREL